MTTNDFFNFTNIKFEIVDENGMEPRRSTKSSAGYDLYSTQDMTIPVNSTRLVKTGVTAVMSDDVVLFICSRSGLALKHSVFVLNACGVVDADYYPNEIGVILHNAGEKDFEIEQGDRIAQGVFMKYFKTDSENVEFRKREGGFGSSGTR